MRRICVPAVALIVSLTAVGAATAADWYVGDRVMVNWTADDDWYPATVVAVEGARYTVVYDDYDRETVTADRIRVEDLAVGARIFCNWLGGGVYYPGAIADRVGDAIVVHYDDGDVEATTLACVRVQ